MINNFRRLNNKYEIKCSILLILSSFIAEWISDLNLILDPIILKSEAIGLKFLVNLKLWQYFVGILIKDQCFILHMFLEALRSGHNSRVDQVRSLSLWNWY